jgi:transposase
MTATTHPTQSTGSAQALFMSLELSKSTWQLTSSIGPGMAPRERRIPAGSETAFLEELAQAKRRFGLPPDAPVRSCYEAGRDGFWVHRWLTRVGVENVMVDSSSIEVPRRARRAKTDRIDGRKLLAMLMRVAGGERGVWKVVHVPSEAEEDQRHLARALQAVKSDRTRVINRIRGLLATQGATVPGSLLRFDLTAVRGWNSEPLLPGLHRRLARECEHLAGLTQQVRALERERRAAVRRQHDVAAAQARCLQQLKGVGWNAAWLYASEIFSWRALRNGRELGALAGLVAAPYQSGATQTTPGITKAGNRSWRAMAVELAWGWLRYQPTSALTRWYVERFSAGGPRARRIGIVALARKLLIALWRYVAHGVMPDGAHLKPASSSAA